MKRHHLDQSVGFRLVGSERPSRLKGIETLNSILIHLHQLSSERPSRLKGIETLALALPKVSPLSGSERPSRLKGIETINALRDELCYDVRKDLPV